MSKFIAVFVDGESDAYEAERALRALHTESSLTLYSMAVLVKDTAGRVSVKDAASDPLEGTALGALTGSLLGILGAAIAGPAALAVGGLAGMASGALAGSFWDLYNVGISADFVDEVSARMGSGKVAVLAEVDEYWETPLDTRVANLGGLVVRTWRSAFEERHAEEMARQSLREFEAARAEWSAAKEDTKARAKKRLDEAQAKLQASHQKIKGDLEKFELDTKHKVQALQTQISNAHAETKTKLEKRLAELKADRESRAAKLKEAWELTKSAIF